MSRKKAAIILAVALLALVGLIWLVTTVTQKDTNQFGKFIRIQNYDDKVENLSADMRDSMESYLYNIVVKNVDSSVNPSKISDAYIREDSNKQLYDNDTTVYNGSFIVDMESIKQSYFVQYGYSDSNTKDVGGNPVVVSCLPKDQLKYGEFKCVDFVSAQTSENDILLQYLPYKNFSFKLSPDATQGDTLVIVAKLDIPQSDLMGDTASRASIVTMYKQEVIKWIESKGADPSKYIIQYNYDDVGNIIPEESEHGDL